jgi:glyoxylate carboligase
MFGYPGVGINGVVGVLDRAGGKIEFIQTRHEEMAAFMASAYAKFPGNSACALRRRGLAHRTFLPGSTMHASTISRSSPLLDSNRATRSARPEVQGLPADSQCAILSLRRID